jgi:NhaA family Na+:H+ antiporter
MSHSSEPIEKIAPFPLPRAMRKFIERESSSGIVMILAALLALIMANSFLYEYYQNFINTSISFGMDNNTVTEPLKLWIKDILMVFFFLFVGLELKREFKEGFLSSRDQLLLPMLAAIGGMAVPAIIYLLLNQSHPENYGGWAVSSATDIAFALAVLLLAGKKAPPAIKVFLLAIAIFDDLGAILIIAFFYSNELNMVALAFSALGVVVLYIFNRLSVAQIMPYLLVGVYLWFTLFHAGIHTTVAGVLVGLAIPVRCKQAGHHLSPVSTCIHFLHPWVGFFILPLFAFTAAGVHLRTFDISTLIQPLTLSIALALFVGKQIGVMLFSVITVRFLGGALPALANWRHVYGVSCLAGIGFTMSLFIGYLAFDESQMDLVKIGVLFGSFLSALWGAVIFMFFCNDKSSAPE